MRSPETDGPGELHYHYSRDEKKAGMSAYTLRNLHPKKGFFKRNRSLAITLVDLSVLVMLFAIIFFYFRLAGPPPGVEGLTVVAEAYRLDGRVYVSIMFERTDDTGPTGNVRVFLRALPADTRIELSDMLPVRTGEVRTLRSVIASSDPEIMLFATIDYATTSKVIEVDVTERIE